MLKKYLKPLTTCLTLMLTSGPVLTAEETHLDGIMAQVGNELILKSDLEKKVRLGPIQMVSFYPANENASNQEKALQDSINTLLVKERASVLKIEVTDEDVQKRIQLTLQNNNPPLTMEQLKYFLEREGKTIQDYEDDIRSQMLIRTVMQREVFPHIKISEKSIEAHYLNHYGNAKESIELAMRKILIRTNQAMSAEVLREKRALAAKVHRKLVDGLGFVEAEQIYSDSDDARSGKSAETYLLGDLQKSVGDHVRRLAIGEFTPPIETPVGLFIFKLVDKKFTQSQEYRKHHREIEAKLRQLELAKQVVVWLKKLRQGREEQFRIRRSEL